MTALKPKIKDSASPLEQLQELMSSDMRAVNACIIDRMQSDIPLIPQLAGYLIASGGKRMRPLLTLSCGAIFDSPKEKTQLLATAVEFIHTATLLHDDVVDNSEERRGQESANLVFGNEASVLVGDFLFSRSFELMTETENLRILKILSRAAAIIAEGEVKQLSTQHNLDTSINDYLAVIEGKTAALFAAACEVGPVLANGHSSICKAMYDFGMNMGMAFQIIDDLLDYHADQKKLGKSIGDDFKEGKITAPIIFSFLQSNATEQEFWQRTLSEKNQTEIDFNQALELIQKHKGLETSKNLAIDYAEKAKLSLRPIPDHPIKNHLYDLIDFTLERSY